MVRQSGIKWNFKYDVIVIGFGGVSSTSRALKEAVKNALEQS